MITTELFCICFKFDLFAKQRNETLTDSHAPTDRKKKKKQ